jgi:hypothetical protein
MQPWRVGHGARYGRLSEVLTADDLYPKEVALCMRNSVRTFYDHPAREEDIEFRFVPPQAGPGRM